MKKMSWLLCLVVLMNVVVACGGATIPASSSAATQTLSLSTPTGQPAPSPLAGTYTTTITRNDLASHPDLMEQQGPGGMDLLGTWVLKFNNNSNWTALNGDYISGRQYIGSGIFKVTSNQLTVVTDSKCLEFYGPLFGPDAQTSTYTWTISGQTLTLKTAQDLCAARKLIFTSHAWARQA
jgi:hypothetical protein